MPCVPMALQLLGGWWLDSWQKQRILSNGTDNYSCAARSVVNTKELEELGQQALPSLK